MEAYQEPQMAAEEEQEEAPLFATPIEKLQVCRSDLLQLLQHVPYRATVASVQEFSIATADIKKLRENGIHSVEALAHSNKRDLVLMKGLSEAKVDKMQKECEAYVANPAQGLQEAHS